MLFFDLKFNLMDIWSSVVGAILGLAVEIYVQVEDSTYIIMVDFN